MVYVYEGHLGALYTSDRPIPVDDLYCDQCGDYDWEIGGFPSFAKFLAYYADHIDCNDGHGGWDIDYVRKEIEPYFDDALPRNKAINIVMANRSDCEEDDDE